MFWIKLIRSLIKTLNSDGTPGQVATGIAIGTVFGLTPLLSLHNLIILCLVVLLNISIPAVMLGFMASVPAGFLLDPAFDQLGSKLLLGVPPLTGLWTAVSNSPGIALANLNNTVVLGSLVSWLVLSIPLFFVARWAVAKYRATIYERVRRTKIARALFGSKIYDLYKMFRPG
ncbi:MAG: TIGR03546 family protein [Gemmatimonadetes bacterium]|nr:TIGR03546 family protein [Gemmatimonadota bacterium]MCZ6760435.1 TIGR03546 family protein [Gemmatimonadota bacterium]